MDPLPPVHRRDRMYITFYLPVIAVVVVVSFISASSGSVPWRGALVVTRGTQLDIQSHQSLTATDDGRSRLREGAAGSARHKEE